MKDKELTEKEIANIILAKEALSKLGYGSAINVKTLCSELGISRKTAYSYRKALKLEKKNDTTKEEENDQLRKKINVLRERIERLELENRILNVVKKGIEDLKKRACGKDEQGDEDRAY